MSNDELNAEHAEITAEVSKAKAYALKQLREHNEILKRGGGTSKSISVEGVTSKLTVSGFTNKMQELTKMVDAVSELEQKLKGD